MTMLRRGRLGFAAMGLVAALGLSACGADTTTDDETAPAETTAGTTAVTDMAGETIEVPASPQAVIATDNRTFGTLAEWDIDLVAAPIDLMPDTDNLKKYTDDADILNLGNHREPNMEAFIAAEPDLVVTGQRFVEYKDEIIQQVGEDVAVVDSNFNPEEGNIAEQLTELTTLLGEVFSHQDEAQQLIDDFNDAVDRATEAYNSEDTVAGLITSGDSINYAAPTTGRAIGPLYDVIDMTPALEDDGSTNHRGDDISVEAIAQANPDWIIALDRDAAVGSGESATAQELLEDSEALKDVTAVKEGQIIYMAPDFYTAEDIQHYTDLFNQLADAWEAAN